MSYASIDGFTKAINMDDQICLTTTPLAPAKSLRSSNIELYPHLRRAHKLVDVVLSPRHAEYRLYIVVTRQVYKLHLVNHSFNTDSTGDMQFAHEQTWSALRTCFLHSVTLVLLFTPLLQNKEGRREK